MTSKRLFVRVLMGLALALGATATISTGPSDAQTRGFFCGRDINSRYGEVPTSMARTARGNVPMIHWVSNWIKNPRWTPQDRCEEASQRFQRYYENGMLNYMRTGNVNGYPVICVASREGGSCREQDVLVTLEPESDPKDVLQQMTDLRYRSREEPLMLSDDLLFYEDGEAYVDIDVFLNKATVQETPSEDLEELW
ncbi:MAG: COP23 domain-containing protein [Hormoscilla sp.]